MSLLASAGETGTLAGAKAANTYIHGHLFLVNGPLHALRFLTVTLFTNTIYTVKKITVQIHNGNEHINPIK